MKAEARDAIARDLLDSLRSVAIAARCGARFGGGDSDNDVWSLAVTRCRSLQFDDVVPRGLCRKYSVFGVLRRAGNFVRCNGVGPREKRARNRGAHLSVFTSRPAAWHNLGELYALCICADSR